MEEIKLFCLPYAGGSAMVYKKWENYIDKSIKVWVLELAGRGRRAKEPYYNSMLEAVEDIFSMVKTEIENCEFAIFGHSLGSILAYELAVKISESNLRQPKHIFYSGRYPPCILKPERNAHLLPEPEFTQRAMSLGGIPKNFIKYDVLLKKAMQTLRADYKILETEGYEPIINKSNSNISVLYGEEDELAEPSDMIAWKEYTKKQCSFHVFEGGHFFLHNNVEGITQIINHALMEEQNG